MTAQELALELDNYDEDAEVIVLWHGYQRRITGVELVEPGLVLLRDEPRTA